MPAIFVYDGKETTLDALEAWRDDLVFGLFKNDLVPTEASEWGDVVVADFSGFAEQAPAAWGAIEPDAFGRATETATAPLTWTHSGGAVANTVYGYYVRTADNTLQFIERFPAPRLMTVAGNQIQILPRILDGNLAPP